MQVRLLSGSLETKGTKMIERKEVRWAILVTKREFGGPFLAGRYCWPNATEEEPRTRTFRTREEARMAKVLAFGREARAVKVTVTVRCVE